MLKYRNNKKNLMHLEKFKGVLIHKRHFDPYPPEI